MSTANQTTADLMFRVSVNPAILSGKPAIRGTRIPVSLILNLLAHGYSFAGIIEEYPVLTENDIRAGLLYAGAALDHDEALLETGIA